MDTTTAFLTREKEALLEDVNDLKRKNDELSSQDNQWEELRRTNEAIQALTALVSSGDNEELKDLRRSRDRFKVLEGEHAALQRRLKEQENKAVNSERAASTARQSLSQAQSRAIEWEKRAKDHESELQSVRSELEQAEESNANLDADLSLVKLQLDERDAEERLAKVKTLKIEEVHSNRRLHGSQRVYRTEKASCEIRLLLWKSKSRGYKRRLTKQRR